MNEKRIMTPIKGCLKTVRELLYPPVCPLCGEVLSMHAATVCAECRARISYVKTPSCLCCGKEIADEEQALCEDCTAHGRSFIRGFPAMNYAEPLTDSIAAFKYKNRRDYAAFYAQEIVRCHGQAILALAPEALIPVPLHRAKLKKRGYNQAQLLAQALSGILHIPVDAEIIERRVNTLPQKALDDEEREKNLKSAFHSTDKIVKYKKVMLVDDIYTTGATIEACTRVLKDKGIAEIYYTSICIGKGY